MLSTVLPARRVEVRVGVGALQVAEQHLLREQLLRALQVAVQEHAHAEAQVGDEPRVQVADLGHAGLGEVAVLLDLLFLEVDQHALDDVADLLQVDRERHDVGPAPAFLLVERLARDLREVELHRGVQLVDDVVLLPQPRGQRAVVGLHDRQHAVQHVLDDVADAHRLARGVGDRQRRRGRARKDRDGAAWPGCRRRGLAGSSRSAIARDLLGPEDEQQRQRDVEAQVEQHDFARRVEVEARRSSRRCARGAGWRSRSRSA